MEWKKGLYNRIHCGEVHLRDSCSDLARTVKENIGIAKHNYQIRIAREAKTNRRGFFQLYRTKVRDKKGAVKSGESFIDIQMRK